MKKLTGKTGKPGATGPQGPGGPIGAAGLEGPQGREGAAGRNGAGTPLFFKAAASSPAAKLAALDGAEILAECNAKLEVSLTLHATAAHGVYHGQYDILGKASELVNDNFKAGQNLSMQGGSNDWEGWRQQRSSFT